MKSTVQSVWFFVIFSTFSLFVLVIYYNSVTGYDSSRYWYLYGSPFLLLFLEQCLFYWLLFRESVRIKRDSEHQHAMEIQQLLFLILKNKYVYVKMVNILTGNKN